MRLFLDQDVYALTERFLREAGHDIVTASDAGLSRAADVDLMAHAKREGRILVTRDRDFGHLALLTELMPGILYLRALPSTLGAVHEELTRIFESYSEERLAKTFVVVEPGRHRVRGPIRRD